MEIKVGKFYRTRHDKKVGPMMLNHDDPSHYGHFKAPKEKWMLFSPIWHADGSFWPNQEREQDLVAEWTEATPEPADVSEVSERMRDLEKQLDDAVAKAMYGDTPEPADIEWGPWEPPGYGAAGGNYMERCINGKIEWCFPVQKQPVVETVSMTGHFNGTKAWFGPMVCGEDTAHITLKLIDGKPDWSTLRGEAL